MSKTPNKIERQWMGRVADLGCIVCREDGIFAPACVHHALTGMGGRRDHMKVLPLCYRHHQGGDGIHHIGRKTWQAKYGSERELLAKVEELLS